MESSKGERKDHQNHDHTDENGVKDGQLEYSAFTDTNIEGTFTADEGWVFEGIINRDGGMWKGELTHFPIPLEWREESVHDLPEFYTGTVEENVLIDVKLK